MVLTPALTYWVAKTRHAASETAATCTLSPGRRNGVAGAAWLANLERGAASSLDLVHDVRPKRHHRLHYAGDTAFASGGFEPQLLGTHRHQDQRAGNNLRGWF